MPFVAPLALLGLVFIPAVVAMYLLKLRRDETVVPSTLLWQRLVADVEANAPWQRLRRSLLLLLQILLVVVLALLAARPFLERPAGLARDIVLVVDTSASMAATDVAPDRLAAAKAAAIEALRDLPAGGKVSVIEAGRTARIVSTGSTDPGRVRRAIEAIRVTSGHGDLGDALELGSELAAQSGDAEILVVTDAALAVPPAGEVDARVRVVRVGDERGRRNQAIVALAVRTAPSGVTRSVFASVANVDLEPATRRLELWGDGRLIEARDVAIDAQTRSDVVIDDVPGDVAVVEVRLAPPGADGAGGGGGPVAADQLAIDDRAWAIVPPDRPKEILIVGRGDPYLETALSFLPNVRLFGVPPADYPAKAQRTDGTDWDLIVFDANLPSNLPKTPLLAIAPPRSGPLGDVLGTLKGPGIGSVSPDEPILRSVDLTTIHIAQAAQLDLPGWARTVIPGPKGAPLLYAGRYDDRPAAVLAFEPRQSDLPLQVAFPILMANLTGELLGGSAAPTESVDPGSPVSLTLPAGATGVRVERPDGTVVDLAPGIAGGSTVTFSQTDLVGVYTATPVRPGGGSAGSGAPSSPPSLAPSPTSTPSPSASGSQGPAPPVDPNLPVRFAVNLFDVSESTITPGSAEAIADLGRPAPAPGASAAPGIADPAANRPAARDELWIPIVLVALVVLCIEWAVYQRDVLVRWWRSARGRLRRDAAGSGQVGSG
jgi:hypothetical protein